MYFSDPDKYAADLTKRLTDYAGAELWNLDLDSEEYTNKLWKEEVRFTNSAIYGGGAESIKKFENKDKSKVKWVITWPDDPKPQEVIRER